MRPHLLGYKSYADHCVKLKTLTATQRVFQFTAICLRRFANGLTYSANTANIINCINYPDNTRRIPLPLINVACRRQHNRTPLGYLLNSTNMIAVDYDNWISFKILNIKHTRTFCYTHDNIRSLLEDLFLMLSQNKRLL